MNRRHTIYLAALAVLMLAAGPLEAQMFGERSLGQPLTRQKGYSQFKTAGTLQWNERFIRSNRDITDFVGPDTREMRGFVGNIQGRSRGRVPTMIEGLRERVDRSDTINRPVDPAPATGMYPAEIVLGFAPPTTDPPQVELQLTERLISSPKIPPSSRFEVWVEGRRATLQGEVPSARIRDLAAALLSFEPGISEIDNQLTVNPQLDPTPREMSASRPRRRWTVQWTAGTPDANRVESTTVGDPRAADRLELIEPDQSDADRDPQIQDFGRQAGNADGD
jgi:hypothetical protein